jgi:mannobiose 2-epimerase
MRRPLRSLGRLLPGWLRRSRLGRLGLAPPQNLAGATPDDASPAEEARACRRLLVDGLVRFYLPGSLDLAWKGYHEVLDGDEFRVTGPKHTIFQSRQLWFFSTLARKGIAAEETRPAADLGCELLLERARDAAHGGFHASVTREGEPEDRRKHAYVHAFALFGLVAYHRATGSEEALAAAREVFETLERRAHDSLHGGYTEWFEPDWTPSARTDPPRLIGAAGRKTFNTHLHLLEAYADLYRVWPQGVLRERLTELITIVTSTVLARPFHLNVDLFSPDWRAVDTETNLRASYGHDLEAVWLVLDALPALGLAPSLYREWAEAVARASLTWGYDKKHGGFYHRGRLGRPASDRTKVWWVQAEAMVALLRLYLLTARKEYREAFARTLRFVERQQAAPGGGWWSELREDGSRGSNARRTGPWQAAYHSGRALLLSAEMLEGLGAGATFR